MATFSLHATTATFLLCEPEGAPSYVMQVVAMRARTLAARPVEASNLVQLRAAVQAMVNGLDEAGEPYALSVRLTAGRAPTGWKAEAATFGKSNAFGRYANAEQ